MSATTGPPRPRKVPRPVLAGLACVLVWVVAHHWPLIPLAHAMMTRQRPGPTAVRYLLAQHGHPVPAALARGDIHAGQPLDEVVARHGPFDVETVGRYQILSEPRPPGTLEFEGYRILARDGVLVGAGWWTCTADIIFFNTFTPDEETACNATLRRHREWLRDARRDARMAVASPAGWYADGLWHEYRQSAEPNAHMAVGGPGGYTAWYGPTSPAPE